MVFAGHSTDGSAGLLEPTPIILARRRGPELSTLAGLHVQGSKIHTMGTLKSSQINHWRHDALGLRGVSPQGTPPTPGDPADPRGPRQASFLLGRWVGLKLCSRSR
jgi:hypothetical protein